MNKRESNRNIQRHKYTSSLHYPSYFCPLVKEKLWWCVGGNVDRSGHDWLIKNQTVGRQEEVIAHACAMCLLRAELVLYFKHSSYSHLCATNKYNSVEASVVIKCFILLHLGYKSNDDSVARTML